MLVIFVTCKYLYKIYIFDILKIDEMEIEIERGRDQAVINLHMVCMNTNEIHMHIWCAVYVYGDSINISCVSVCWNHCPKLSPLLCHSGTRVLATGLLVVADGRDDAATCNITILFKRLRCVIFDDSSMGKEKKKIISQTILSMVFMCVPVSSTSDLNQNIPQKHYGKLTTITWFRWLNWLALSSSASFSLFYWGNFFGIWIQITYSVKFNAHQPAMCK